MNRKHSRVAALLTVAILTLGLALAAATVVAQQSASEQSESALPIATAEHKALMNGVGTWDANMKVYINGPDADPLTATAVETNTRLGEFWLLSSLEYEIGGQKIQGRGQFGYDPVQRKFVGTFCDNSSPYLSTLAGTWNESEKTWTYMLQGRDQTGTPTTGKLITRLHGTDRKTFEMFVGVPGVAGRYIKMMDVEYTRRK